MHYQDLMKKMITRIIDVDNILLKVISFLLDN